MCIQVLHKQIKYNVYITSLFTYYKYNTTNNYLSSIFVKKFAFPKILYRIHATLLNLYFLLQNLSSIFQQINHLPINHINFVQICQIKLLEWFIVKSENMFTFQLTTIPTPSPAGEVS